MTTQSPYGIYTVKLPLNDGKIATMTGVCLDQITATFPQYPIRGKVAADIKATYRHHHGHVTGLPQLPISVGGDVDFMVGI